MSNGTTGKRKSCLTIKFANTGSRRIYHFAIVILSVFMISTFSFSPSSFPAVDNGRVGFFQEAYAAKFLLLLTEQVYVPGEPLIIYGVGEPNDVLVIRLYDPAGLPIKTENVSIDEDGVFREGIYKWPQPARNATFGTYTIEANSSIRTTDTQRIEVTFAEAVQSTDGPRVPVAHILGIKLDSPDQVSVNEQFRIFIQVTFDGALVAVEDQAAINELLGTSHLHSGNSSNIHSSNATIVFADKIRRLHEGLYYTDVTLNTEGTYIIHSVAFYRGLLSHDSKVITAAMSSISTIQESVIELDSRLNSTNQELARLEAGLDETGEAVNDTKTSITTAVEDARRSIREDIEMTQQASGQLNSIILPVLALISVIIALQISLFARIRASYR